MATSRSDLYSLLDKITVAFSLVEDAYVELDDDTFAELENLAELTDHLASATFDLQYALHEIDRALKSVNGKEADDGVPV
jgi:hypothetical protein